VSLRRSENMALLKVKPCGTMPSSSAKNPSRRYERDEFLDVQILCFSVGIFLIIIYSVCLDIRVP
jgi:hypothetical protein